MLHMHTALSGMYDLQACSCLQIYILKQVIEKFGEKCIAATHKEMRQLHIKVVFELISIIETTNLERKIAMGSLIFLN